MKEAEPHRNKPVRAIGRTGVSGKRYPQTEALGLLNRKCFKIFQRHKQRCN